MALFKVKEEIVGTIHEIDDKAIIDLIEGILREQKEKSKKNALP